MAKSVKLQLDKFFKKLGDSVAKQSKSPTMIKGLAEFAITLIVKRTRLGYGVAENFGQRSALRRLTPRYITARRRGFLASTTTAGRSNLTRTGQMLNSMSVIRMSSGKAMIGPTGTRDDGKKNADIAEYQRRQGRPFNNLSQNEFNQLVRFYRKNFGDLLSKRRLLT